MNRSSLAKIALGALVCLSASAHAGQDISARQQLQVLSGADQLPIVKAPAGTLVAGGIRGRVTIGPMCGGPSRPDRPCPDKPYQATITIWRDDAKIAVVRSDANGEFALSLEPGTYRVVAEAAGRFPRPPGAVLVTVEKGRPALVELRYDSGMR